MLLTTTIKHLDELEEEMLPLREVRDTTFQYDLQTVFDSILEAKHEIVQRNMDLEEKIKKTSALLEEKNIERDKILKKYAQKDNDGNFILETVKDQNGKDNQIYCFEESVIKERDAEVSPLITEIAKIVSEYNEQMDALVMKQEKVNITLLQKKYHKSKYFNFRELAIFEKIAQ